MLNLSFLMTILEKKKFLDPPLSTVRQNFHVRLEIHVEDIYLALKDVVK